MKIFVTGATGFLGYNIVLTCVDKGYDVLCLRRIASKSLFTSLIESKIHWVNYNDENWKNIVNNFNPDVLIHAAWAGVSAKDRNDKCIQEQNVKFSQDLFTLYPYKQIVSLGSQDEYGRIDKIVDENDSLNPISEYAKAKIDVCKYLYEYCTHKQIEWQWIRVFSVYGEKQKSNWIIPSVIDKCLKHIKYIDTTKGEQKYAYIYVGDFSKAIISVLGIKGKCGIYNLSSSNPVALNEIFQIIKRETKSQTVFNLGAIKYREHQSMIVAGNSIKFIRAFGQYEFTSIEDGIKRTIDHYSE